MLDNYAINPTPAVLAYLNERQRTASDGSVYFANDDGHPHLDIHRDGIPNADARAVAAWTRKHRPDLWDATPNTASAAETAPTVSTVASTATAADIMAAVKSGRLSADDAARRLLDCNGSTTPKPAATASKPSGELNFTTLMTKARAGDNAALDALKRMVHTQ